MNRSLPAYPLAAEWGSRLQTYLLVLAVCFGFASGGMLQAPIAVSADTPAGHGGFPQTNTRGEVEAKTESAQPSGAGEKVLRTLDLSNGTVFSGNVVPPVCTAYTSVADVPGRSELYAACNGTDSLEIFSIASSKLFGQVNLGNDPTSVVYDAASLEVFVAVNGSGKVAILDADSENVTNSITISGNPDALALDNSSNTVFVASYSTGKISEIDATNDTLIGSIQLNASAGVNALSFDPDDGDLYASEQLLGRVAVVSVSSGSTIDNVSVDGIPTAIACDYRTGDMFVSIYLPSTNFDPVRVISPNNNTVIANVTVGFGPEALVYYPPAGLLYVANLDGNLTVVNPLTFHAVRSISIGGGADGLTYDPDSNLLFVSELDANDIAVVNLSSNLTTEFLSSNPGPDALAWSETTRSVLVADRNTGTVDQVSDGAPEYFSNGTLWIGLSGIAADSADNHTFVSDTDNQVFVLNQSGETQARIPVLGWPAALSVSPSAGLVFVADSALSGVTFVNASNDSISKVIGIPGGAVDDAYDDSNGDLYVAVEGCLCSTPGEVVFLNGTTGSQISSINAWAQPGPSAILADPVHNSLLVTDGYANGLWKFNLTSGALLGFVGVGSAPLSLSLDPSTGLVYVANSESNNVTVINESSMDVLGSISVGDDPQAVAFDPANGLVYVANAGSGTISVVDSVLYPVTFHESGLPPGTPWAVNLSGTLESANDSSIFFELPNGTSNYSVLPVSGWVSGIPYSDDQVVIDGAPVFVTINWTRYEYLVEFIEIGLLPGVSWGVTVAGSVLNSSSSTISLSEPNGTYPYAIERVPGWSVIDFPITGNLTVRGSPVVLTTVWVQATYSVLFVEFGLPHEADWWVNISGLDSAEGEGSSITLEVPNGTFQYEVATANKTYSALGGTFTVSGSSFDEEVNFTPVLYGVTFSESGLGPDEGWGVSIGGRAYESEDASLAISEVNGTYAFLVTPVAGYTAEPHNGTLVVNGHEVSLHVQFSQSPVGPSTNGSLGRSWFPFWVMAGGVCVGLVTGVLNSTRRRTIR